MRSVIEQDICAECEHLRPSQQLPTDKSVPPFGVFDIQCDCAEDWPYTRVFASANARSECPKFSPNGGLKPLTPWPFPAGQSRRSEDKAPRAVELDAPKASNEPDGKETGIGRNEL